MKKVDKDQKIIVMFEEPISDDIVKLVNDKLKDDDVKNNIYYSGEDIFYIRGKDENKFLQNYQKVQDICNRSNLKKSMILEIVSEIEMCNKEVDIFSNIIDTKTNTECKSILEFGFIYSDNLYVCMVKIKKVLNNKYVVIMRDTFDEDIDVADVLKDLKCALDKIVCKYFVE